VSKKPRRELDFCDGDVAAEVSSLDFFFVFLRRPVGLDKDGRDTSGGRFLGELARNGGALFFVDLDVP